jgi:hypothetical protein
MKDGLLAAFHAPLRAWSCAISPSRVSDQQSRSKTPTEPLRNVSDRRVRAN